MEEKKINKEIFEKIDKKLLKKFKEFHIENPEVFKKFRQYSLKMRETGKEKYSAWTIINYIRWEEDLKTKKSVFKINNDFIALYARLLIYYMPDFEYFFSMRKMKESGRKISGEEATRVYQESKNV